MASEKRARSRFPIHEELDVLDGVTIYKNADWWKAVILYDGFSGNEIGVYLWKRDAGGWKRKRKYVVRSREDWQEDRAAIEEFLTEL